MPRLIASAGRKVAVSSICRLSDAMSTRPQTSTATSRMAGARNRAGTTNSGRFGRISPTAASAASSSRQDSG